jgi:hypothetical protein
MDAVTHTAVERKRSRLMNGSNDRFRVQATDRRRPIEACGLGSARDAGAHGRTWRGRPCRCRDRPARPTGVTGAWRWGTPARFHKARAPSMAPGALILNSLTRHRDHSIPLPRAWCRRAHTLGRALVPPMSDPIPWMPARPALH